MNKVILIGNLANDPEIKTTTNGIAVATFTVAVNHTYTSANGEKGVDFIRCVSFRKQAENVGRYITKGSKVAVEGRISTRTYDAQDGSKRYVTEVIVENVQFLDSKGQGQGQQGEYQQKQNTNQPNQLSQTDYQKKADDFFDDNANIDISEDDLPF